MLSGCAMYCAAQSGYGAISPRCPAVSKYGATFPVSKMSKPPPPSPDPFGNEYCAELVIVDRYCGIAFAATKGVQSIVGTASVNPTPKTLRQRIAKAWLTAA